MGTAEFVFHRDEPLFGLDIGQTSLKVMQLDSAKGKAPKVVGYGVSDFYPKEATKDGAIVDQKVIGGALKKLLGNQLIGSITTANVACTLPTAHTFSRPMKVPKMSKDHLEEAIQLEAEQYIPLPPDKIYLDYEITHSDDQNIELLIVASPRQVVDSYLAFLNMVGLKPLVLEPSMSAVARLFKLADPAHDQPTILIDFGSVAIDICVLDQTLLVNSTVQGGSDTITEMVAKKLGISTKQAFVIKNKDGIGYSDELRDIVPAIKPLLDDLVREIRRIIRYYDNRIGHTRKITQIITLGGGGTMKGLNEFLKTELNIPSHIFDPWAQINFGNLQPPAEQARSLYLTVAGEAIISSQELHS